MFVTGCALIRLLTRSLAHFAYSQARGKMSDVMSQYHIVLNHSAAVTTTNTTITIAITITITITKLKKIAIFCQFCHFCHICLLRSSLGPIFLDS